jgi:hypothetical protein
MTSSEDEPGLTQRLDERPKFSPGRVRKTPRRDIIVRFLAGAGTSVLSGLATIVFGPHIGGIFLGFPAILAASLTLIEEQGDSAEAREDARGAIVGGLALGLFALVAALAIGHIAGALALILAAGAWALGALAIYGVLWWR